MSIWKNLIWVIKQIYFFDKKYIFFTLFSIITAGVLPPIFTLLSQEIINSIQTKKSINIILLFIFIYVFLDIYENLFSYISEYYKAKYSLNFGLHFKEMLLEKATKLNLKAYEDSETYDIINMAQYKGNSSLLSYFEVFGNIFSSLLTITGYLLIILSFNPYIVLCVILMPIIKFHINNRISLQGFILLKNRTNDSRKSSYFQDLMTFGEFFKELKIFNLRSYFLKIYKEYQCRFNKEDLDLKKTATIKLSIVSFAESLIDAGLFGYIIFCGYTNKILLGNVLTYTQTMLRIK